MLGSLGLEVVEVDIAGVFALDGDDAHAGHDCGGWVCAVGAGWDEADIAVGVALVLVVGLDDHEAGVFALSAGVGLEGDGGEAGDVGEPGLEGAEELGVASPLGVGGEGVDVGELGPCDGEHLACGVELHRA